MTTDTIDILFDEFSQAESSTTRLYGGTGLGLPIVGRIVRLLNGDIKVDSAPDSGSTFTVILPMKNGESQTLDVSDTLQGVRVLLVDDLSENIRVFGKLLEYFKVNLTTVDSPYNAQQELTHAYDSNEPFEIAILDHYMPEMGGLQLAEWIRGPGQI